MERILLVEDDDVLRQAAAQVLANEGYEVTSVHDGNEALQLLHQHGYVPDLIVSDINMPHVDGFALLNGVRSTDRGMTIPFLFVSASNDPAKVSQARRLGADDYLFKPFELQELLDAVRARLDRRRKVLLLDTREAHIQTVKMLANAIEARDHYTRGHVDRVSGYALRLAASLGWSREQLSEVEFGATLHDVGKVLVPENVLNKTGPLLPDEAVLVRRHVEIGAQILTGVTHLQAAIPYILYHHERWSGRGYPTGLAGEDIPVQGRLLAIVDSFDAMTSARPYREAMSEEAALEEVRLKQNIDFDPDMVDAFLQMIEQFDGGNK
jgi:putative two-component system response regulator